MMAERPQKRTRLLSEDEDESDAGNISEGSGEVSILQKSYCGDRLEPGDFKINEEYARRFEHNQRRAEMHRCMNACLFSSSP